MLLRILLVVAGLVLVLGGAYWFWTTTPLYALQEAGLAARDHNLPVFEQRVNIDFFVESLINDVLVNPTQTTPGLSGFQREVAAGAIGMAKASLETELTTAIRRSVAPAAGRRFGWRNFKQYGPDAAIAESSGGELTEFLHTATRAVSRSLGNMKQVAYNRMQEYARNHRYTIPGRLLSCPAYDRAEQARQMLQEFGLTQQNFRGLAYCKSTTGSDGGEVAKAGFNFFSPKVNHNITVELELAKGSAFSDWRVARLSNLPDVFNQLELNYENDMHALMAYSLAGMSNRNVNNEIHGVTDTLKNSDAAQSFLRRFNIKLR